MLDEQSVSQWFVNFWNNAVWSKVIGAAIYAVLYWLWTEGSKFWKRDLARKLSPHVADVVLSNDPGFPLKIYVEMRNNTKKPIEVQLLDYKNTNISLSRFSQRTLQLFFFKWEPRDESVDRIGVYPGQRFRAWLGADPKKHTEQQIRESVGSIGTLTVSVNGKEIPIKL